MGTRVIITKNRAGHLGKICAQCWHWHPCWRTQTVDSLVGPAATVDTPLLTDSTPRLVFCAIVSSSSYIGSFSTFFLAVSSSHYQLRYCRTCGGPNLRGRIAHVCLS